MLNKPTMCASFLRQALSRCGSYMLDFVLLCLLYDNHLARTRNQPVWSGISQKLQESSRMAQNQPDSKKRSKIARSQPAWQRVSQNGKVEGINQNCQESVRMA